MQYELVAPQNSEQNMNHSNEHTLLEKVEHNTGQSLFCQLFIEAGQRIPGLKINAASQV